MVVTFVTPELDVYLGFIGNERCILDPSAHRWFSDRMVVAPFKGHAATHGEGLQS